MLKRTKINDFLKKELLAPTKIYTKEIINLVNKNLINSSANITGGGIIENITRSVPIGLTVNIDLSKIKIQKIFKWIKNKNFNDLEMLKTFNCGVGFCIITDKKIFLKLKNILIKNINRMRLDLYPSLQKR